MNQILTDPPTFADANSLESASVAVAQRVEAMDWPAILKSLDQQGFVVLPGLLTAAECAQMVDLYGQESLFRKRVVMERHQYGRGEYQYFAYPLPAIAQSLRETLYLRLVPLANQWNAMMGIASSFPNTHRDYVDRCHQAGQPRPTPLLLKYQAGDFNCLHQDLYGELVFPLQAAIVLNAPGRDFTGGEFVLTEQKARAQARVHVLSLQQGEGVVFAVNHRPVQGTQRTYRVTMKHGVSQLHSGQRHCLGIIFHDAA